jgi:hypothetical protein
LPSSSLAEAWDNGVADLELGPDVVAIRVKVWWRGCQSGSVSGSERSAVMLLEDERPGVPRSEIGVDSRL